MNKMVAVVGMPGAGKSVISDMFVERGLAFVRFGQLTIDTVKEWGLERTEANEKYVREELRKKYGPGAYATLNLPKFKKALEKSHLVGDGLYSWEEFKILKKEFRDNLIVTAVYASPKTRYDRLESRADKYSNDPKARFRSLAREEAKARDVAQLQNINTGPPIAMADYTFVNEGSLEELRQELERFMKKYF